MLITNKVQLAGAQLIHNDWGIMSESAMNSIDAEPFQKIITNYRPSKKSAGQGLKSTRGLLVDRSHDRRRDVENVRKWHIAKVQVFGRGY